MQILIYKYEYLLFWFQVIRNGIPQLVSTVSLRDWYDTALDTISHFVCVLPSRCFLVTACFVTTNRTPGK